jgi:DNA adenine methylase
MMRYHGGKWRLAPWVIAHLPPHQIYVEPFGGAASVLLRKERSAAEVYNDLDDEIVNLFAVMRDPATAAVLQRACEYTPFSRSEFNLAYKPCDDLIERARRILVRSWMGHGSAGVRMHKTGFRADPCRRRTTSADDWKGWPRQIDMFTERLRGVIIEQRPAQQLLTMHDGPDALFYLDPPYLFGTRSKKRKGSDLYHGYKHEMSDDAHVALIARVQQLKGMVVISGYHSDLYDEGLAGWRRVEKRSQTDQGGKRTEVMWINPAAAKALDRVTVQHDIFHPRSEIPAYAP